jgi:kinesin family member 26
MLRVSDNPPGAEAEKSTSHMSIDKKKRQVTLSEPPPASQSSQSSMQNVSQDRALMVSAPKMFAFDALHTNEDSQVTHRR